MKIEMMALHYGTLMLLAISTVITYACMSTRKVNTVSTKCKTPLDCDQYTPHVCIKGRCKSIDEVKKQKQKPKDVAETCNNFLDCTPGLQCVSGYCVQE